MKLMWGISRASIKNKLIYIILLASMSGFLVIGISLVVHEYIKLKEIQQNELLVTSNIVAEATAGMVLFGDADGVKSLLKSLRLWEHVRRVMVFDEAKQLFASYENGIFVKQQSLTEVYESNAVSGYAYGMSEIKLDDRVVGYVYIEANDSLVNQVVLESLVAVFVYIFIGMIIVYFIALKMQKLISDPISHLTETAVKITHERNYKLRAVRESDDEIGDLTEEFNSMLDVLHENTRDLIQSERKFRKVVEQAVEAFFIVDSESSIIDVNAAACKVFEYDREQLLELHWSDIDGGMQEPVVFSSLLKKLEDQDHIVIETEYMKSNGKLFPVEANIGLMEIDKQKFVLVAARDNTERKMAEERLKQANDMLEAKVSERTSELKNANLALSLAKEKAEAANRAKSLFLANMSHEIRTPMNSVIGFTDVLANSGLNDKQASYVESIQAGSRNLLSLINDILDISKIEAGKLQVKFEKVYLKQLLNDIKEVFSISAAQKNLYLEVNVDDDVPDVIMSDEVRLRQIIFNLVNNAIKFTREGGVRVAVRNEFDSENLFYDLVIEVCDTGIGVRTEDQEKIFNVFEQQDGQSTREFGGAGLGLAISTRLAERLNSSISIESEEGKGSCFRLLIKSPEIVLQDRSGTEIKDGGKGLLNSVKVLVADDVEENRHLIAEYLSRQPLELVFAKDGVEAVEKVRSEKPSVVLMDIRMPNMSGTEALKIIKEDESLSGVVVIAVTASVMEDKNAMHKRSLFDAILYKPLKRQALIQALGDFIGYQLQADVSEQEEEQDEKRFVSELSRADEGFINKIREYKPTIERAINRGSFGGLNQLLDELNYIGDQYNMVEFHKLIERVRRSNEHFDIEETQRLLTQILSDLASVRGAQSE